MFDELLELSLARARRHALGVSVISLDIDNFKLVNDSLGHEAGDELIVLLSERLREATRETDLVARPGGDEFLMLLADLERTSAVAGRGSRRWSSPSPSPRGSRTSLAAAVRGRGHRALRDGVPRDQRLPEPRRDAETLLKHADNAMFRSKQVGPGGSFMHAAGDRRRAWASCRSAPGCGRPSRTRAGCSTTSR